MNTKQVIPFIELSRRSRLYRIRDVGKQALKIYGMPDASLKFIQYFANIIYRVDVPGYQRCGRESGPFIPGRYVLRIHAMRDTDAIGSELTWLAALSQEAGLSVPAPVLTVDGKLIATILTPGIPNGRVVSLMRWLDGRSIRHGLRPEHLTALGQAVAQMHNFSASWQAPTGFSRPHWDWSSQLGGSMFDHAIEELVESMPKKYQEPFQIISEKIKKVMASMGKGADAYGLIHADLYPENVLFKSGKAYPIDFEDCGYGYWMWDISIALCNWAWGEQWERMRDAFREGYSRTGRLPEAQWAQLDLFVATQFATMLLWLSEFIKNDPRRETEYIPLRESDGMKLLGYFSR